jgi:ATP-binding cassette subfamily B protein
MDVMIRWRRDAEAVRGKKLERELVRRVLGLARPYRGKIIGFLVAVIATAVTAVLQPLLLRTLINSLIKQPRHIRSLVTALAIAAVFLAGANAALSMVQRWLQAQVGEGVIFDLRSMLFNHVQRMPIAFFTRTQTGALISRMNNDVIGAQQALTGTLGSVVSNVIGIAATLIVMANLEWRLTIITLAVLPGFIIPAKRMGRRLQAIAREQMQLNASMNTTMTERLNVAGALVVKLFGRHQSEAEGFDRRAARVRDIGVQSAIYQRVLFVGLGMVAAVGTAVVYLLGGRLVISGRMQPGDVVAFAAFTGQLYAPLTALTSARVDVLTAFVSFERVFEVLDLPHAIADRPDARPLDVEHPGVVFDHVTFRYPTGPGWSLPSLEETPQLSVEPGALVLRDVSFTAAPGQLVALVGPSGAGKTTMVNLIPRLYDVTEGRVLVGGHDVRDVTLESLRARIGVVAQDPHLFHDTVASNLRYARPDATDDDIVAACKAARIHDVIVALPEGYHTVVGERGYRLSGGEKQRVAIARMLLKNPAVVILDEATSHLDSESELAIQHALADALRGRTSLVIAHRLSTIVNADVILVVDGGRIVDTGTHSELLARGGLYAELYRTQYSRAATAEPA